MRTILQLSDFHIKETMPQPENNMVFTSMVEALKSLKLENTILVYNGDAIDTKAIMEKIDKALPLDEQINLWDEGAAKAYKLAKEYFDYLTTSLSISNDRIIICCGNHDINPYYVGKIAVDCPDPSKKAFYHKKRFEQFSRFCDQIQLRKNTWGTYFREIDNMNILVVNTNWVNKWGQSGLQKLCIACREVEACIYEKKERLVRTIKNKSKLYNIFVAHAPRTDYCEESLYRYDENSQSPVMEMADRYFGLKLYGDKHTDNVHNFDYIVGSPLDTNNITCGIHQFDNECHYHHKSLVFSNSIWKLVGSEGDIGEILEISRDSIKPQALEYLFGSRSVDGLEDRIKNFGEVRSGESWVQFDKLIRAYADIQKPQLNSAGIPVNANDGFINTLTTLISDSTNRVSITLRGEERVGKSVCMSFLYFNLLYRFISGTFEYLPVYINVDQVMCQVKGDNRDSLACTKKIQKLFSNKLKQGIELAARLQCPACCIVDGISKFFIYEKAKIETVIADEIESAYGKRYAHYIYCIDTGNNTGLGSTPQHNRKDAEYVVYFNRILTKKVNSKKKYKTFVKAFCALRDAALADQTSKIVLNNIERMGILEVDTSLLINFWNDLSVDNQSSFFEIIDKFVRQHISAGEIKNAAKACYLYYQRGGTYTEIKKSYKISNYIFELIRTQKLVARYLLAANYVLSIQDFGKTIDDSSCLNIRYNHEVCAFIREYIRKYDAEQQIKAFAHSWYIDLSFEGKATISYLLGRVELDKSEIAKILDEHDKHLSSTQVDVLDKASFHKSIAQRSVRLSKMFTESNTCLCLREYIGTLIADNYERKINRIFYLQFYGDQKQDVDDYI